ncbi:hypothetical protein [Rhodococcus sp. X156]|uniref:hypothetical protein n=1 Tax=Rhodococcus sp. X156 TaxID=2499145 RepID=UPI000FD7BE19|nr:hypothetical protein [Rhodococcus sp. X156]
MSHSDAPDDGGWRTLLDPPYPLDLIADLHAGVLEPDLAEALWPRAAADPHAAQILAALDATVAQLSTAHAPDAGPVPAELAARIDAALAAEPAGVGDLAAARTRRRSSRRTTTAAVAGLSAAAVAAVVALSVTLGPQDVTGTPQAISTPSSAAVAPLDLGSGTPGPQALRAVGKQDLGPLAADALAGCLTANGFPATAPVLGSSEVVLDGQPGVLLLLPTGQAAVFTALVVGPDCATDNAATRSRVDIGAR